jgi:hypothetical protein
MLQPPSEVQTTRWLIWFANPVETVRHSYMAHAVFPTNLADPMPLRNDDI